MKTFWLSFVDPDRPPGTQFLGVALIEVTEADAAALRPVVAAHFPRAGLGADWLAAATQKARRLGCNPGGEVRAYEIPPDQLATSLQLAPRHRLLSRRELIALDLI